MITATKKSRTSNRVLSNEPLSGRGGVGQAIADAEMNRATRPKNKRMTGDRKDDTEYSVAGRAKTKTRKCNNATDTPVARRGVDLKLAATKQTRGGDPAFNADTKHAPRASSNGTAGGEYPDTEEYGVSRAKNKRGRGETNAATDARHAASAETNGHAKNHVTPKVPLRGPAGGGEGTCDTESTVASACLELQELQRQAVHVQKSRIMIGNRITATVAQAIGYRGGLEKEERDRLWKIAGELLTAVMEGTEIAPEYQQAVDNVRVLVLDVRITFNGFEKYEANINKQMIAIVKSLPIYGWITDDNQRGIGELSVARVLGETGDLANYAGPAKVWKRMGCAPYKGKMPHTWRTSKPSLSAGEWTECGYVPRRRSVVWNIEECIIKSNKGTHRKRFDDSKARFFETHEGCKKGHANNHAHLMCGKEFLKQLWKAWNKA